MTIKVDNVQIGQNATATQNFTLKQGADGTCTLARGNVGATTQDILTVDAAGLVATPAGSKNLTLMTAQATTSGTSIDFTSIPSWVKRITVMLNGVSTNGATHFLVQVGSGSVSTSGYRSNMSVITGGTSPSTAQNTTGFAAWHANAAEVIDCTFQIHLLSSNVWMSSHSGGNANTTTPYALAGGGSISLGGTLDRIRLTTVNGTDTFDAGSVNVMYEG